MDRYKLALVGMVVASLAVMAAVLALAPTPAPEKKGLSLVHVEIDFNGYGPGKDAFYTAIWSTAGDTAFDENWTSDYTVGYMTNGSADWIIHLKIDNGTVFDVLEDSSKIAHFTFKSEWYPNFRSHRVTEIAGVKDGTDGRYWQYYVNGQYMGTGADQTGLKDGDVVRWEFRSALQ
jgi:hypothetical protein